MNFIKHIIEPTRLLLAWQSLDESHRTRYIVGELNNTEEGITLTYLVNTRDFSLAEQRGFEPYTAFEDIHKTHHNVLDSFMRRLPPRSRGDFPQYLEGIRLERDAVVSDFALLGYSGARLLSDGFSIIHPFSHIQEEFELLLEIAGFRHLEDNVKLDIGTHAAFIVEEKHEITQETAIRITAGNKNLGYVNRGLIPTVIEWINDKRIAAAWIEKLNGTPNRPAAYLYVQIAEKNDIG
jgi:hypothetical protein